MPGGVWKRSRTKGNIIKMFCTRGMVAKLTEATRNASQNNKKKSSKEQNPRISVAMLDDQRLKSTTRVIAPKGLYVPDMTNLERPASLLLPPPPGFYVIFAGDNRNCDIFHVPGSFFGCNVKSLKIKSFSFGRG